MIGRISGKLIARHPPQVIVDVQGIGYEIDVPMSTFYQLPATGSDVTLFTHLLVREDAHLLYGIASEQERHVGVLLLIRPNLVVSINGMRVTRHVIRCGFLIHRIFGVTCHLVSRQIFRWIDWLSLQSDFKMEFYRIAIGVSHFRNFLTFSNSLTFFDQDGFVVRIS